MDGLRFFCLDSRIKDVQGSCEVIHFCRDLEDQSILVIDTFRPYLYVTSPFEDARYERIRDRLLDIDPEAFIEKVVFTKGVRSVESAKISFSTIEAYQNARERIRALPDRFLELFPRARLLKRYLLERGLVPLTVWSAAADPFPYDARVPAYRATSIEQNDSLTYESPSCESFSILPESLAHSLIASKDPVRTVLFSGAALTWDRTMVVRASARYVDSEIDLIDATRRHLLSNRAAILAGFRSDTVDFPRVLARVDSYRDSGQRVNFSLSDDFSLPYHSRYGTSILGMVHLDVAKASELVSRLKGYEDLEPLLNALSIEIHEDPDRFVDGQKRMLRLTKAAAEKLYPLFAELSKVCRDQVFDVSRQPLWRTYESYVDTYCLTNGICYDSFSPDEEFGNAPVSDMAESEVVFSKYGVRIPHMRAYLAAEDNVSRESAQHTRKGDGSSVRFSDAKNGPIEALRALLARQDRLRIAAEGLENAPVTARLRAHELLADGFEQAIGNRASTLYFPEGAGYLRRREHEELGRASRNVSAIVDQFIFTDQPDKLAQRLSKLDIYHELLELQSALVTREPLGAFMLSSEHGFLVAGKARLDRTVPSFVLSTRDVLARKILLGSSREDVEMYVRERIEELVSGKVSEEELVSQVTMHRAISEYENELFFVQAARELRDQGFFVEKGTTIPYLVIEDGDSLAGAPPGTHRSIAYRYYAESKLRPALEPLLRAAGVEPSE